MTLTGIIETYKEMAEKSAERKENARQEMSDIIRSVITSDNFDAKVMQHAWSSASQRHRNDVILFLNADITPNQTLSNQIARSERFKKELHRRIENDPLYRFTTEAVADKERFFTPEGIKIIMKMMTQAQKERYLLCGKTLKENFSQAFLNDYFANLNLLEYKREFTKTAEATVEERLRTTLPVSGEHITRIVANEITEMEREDIIYDALAVAYGAMADYLLRLARDIIPSYYEAYELACTLNAEENDFDEYLHSMIVANDLENIIGSRLLRTFTADRMLYLLESNESCGDYVQKTMAEWEAANQCKRELEFNMVTTMPESYKGLYPATRQMVRSFIIHSGPTNSGKTFAGMQALKEHRNGVYLSPLRMLALEKADELNGEGYPCNLITGEEEYRVDGARFTASTIEMADLSGHYECAVIDEAQMITDRYRGGAWAAAIMGLQANEIHVCCSPWAVQLIADIIDDCDDDCRIVRHKRTTKLLVERTAARFPQDIRPHDAVIAFTRSGVHAIATELERVGITCSIIYGSLPYDVRQNEAARFRRGETSVIVATDAIGMGLNLPVERVVFAEFTKFDGVEQRELTCEEIRQIAGRAGRRGIFETGYVTSLFPWYNSLIAQAVNTVGEQDEKATFGFPSTLLGINSPVSELMTEWQEMPAEKGFVKTDLTQQIKLAQIAEKFVTDRQTVYRLSMIPFDQTNNDCFKVWLSLARSIARDRFSSIDAPVAIPGDTLQELEENSKLYDIYYHFGRVFGNGQMMETAMEAKKRISVQITVKLRERFARRKCADCGQPLPIGTKYRYCSVCYKLRKASKTGAFIT